MSTKNGRSCFASQELVRAAMLKKIADSTLDKQDAITLKFRPVLPEGLPDDNLPARRAGFIIPYFDFSGKPSKFYRVRYLEYGNERGFAAQTTGSNDHKLLRYGQPAGTLNEVYMPPMDMDWKDYAKDSRKPLIITEGELKAACATKHGIPTIALGGVWCFKSSKRGLPLIDQLKAFDWMDRVTYICYDSDAASNPDVMGAENALARELLSLKAHPYIVRLPALEDGKKTGIDDFIVAKGDAVFFDLVKKSEEWEASSELFRLNEEVVYVQNPGNVVVLKNFQVMNPMAFYQHAYADRKYHRKSIDGKGNVKLEERSAARDWIQWPARGVVGSLTYKPGQPIVTSEGELNAWRGWAIEPKKGDVGPWHKLLDKLFGKDDKTREWFERWLAYPLQHPGRKLYSSCLLWGRYTGVGKSLIGYTMFKIYGANATEIKDHDLHASHNEWIKDKQFIMGDEIVGGETKRAIADRMKSMITQVQLRINPKFVSAYTVPDCVNYYFTSNHADAFFLEDQDRRFMVHEVRDGAADPGFYKGYVDQWLKMDGPGALFQYMLDLYQGDFNPAAHALSTESKQDMINIGRSDLGDWVSRLREDPDGVLRNGSAPVAHKLWTTSQLLTFYDPEAVGRVTANGMARELRRAGFRKVYKGQNVPGLKDGSQRLWAIRDAVKLLVVESSARLAEVYNEERDLKAKGAHA